MSEPIFSLSQALGIIVFDTETLDDCRRVAGKLRQAAALLEYRYAMERRDTAQRGQQAAPAADAAGEDLQRAAPRKRNRGRPASNGAATPPPPNPPAHDPLFPVEPRHATEE